jgi:DNA-3-methyladenine glycosylase II
MFCASLSRVFSSNQTAIWKEFPKRIIMKSATPKRTTRSSAAAAASVVVSPDSSQTSNTDDTTVKTMVDQLLQDAGITNTLTKSNWCLRDGLVSICQAHNSSLLPLVMRHGPPTFYSVNDDDNNNNNKNKSDCRHHDSKNAATNNMSAPKDCFQSLCRIIAGQQLAGAAAQAVWRRLLDTVDGVLTPAKVLQLAEQGLEDELQKPAGLSKAKARAIVDLANHYATCDLTEDFLRNGSDEEIRQALLDVRGLGPWSCDMFAMFTLERANILPLGDLGVRKGVARHFRLRGSGNRGDLCPKKDVERIHSAVKAFAPYHSLLSFYMWKAADTVDFYNDSKSAAVDSNRPTKKARK